MSERKTPQERIAALEKKETQLRAKRQALIAKEKEAERKATIKRQIEIGKVTEEVYGIPIENIDMSQFKAGLESVVAVERVIGEPISKDNLPQLLMAIKQVIGKSLNASNLPKFLAKLRVVAEIERKIGKPLEEADTQEILAKIDIGQATSEVLRRPVTQSDTPKVKKFLQEQQKEQFISEMEG